jgi:hypothetical protein
MTDIRWTEDDLRRVVRNKAVRSSTDARRTTVKSGSSCEAAIQQTISRRGESASSPTFAPYQLALTGQLPSGKNQVQLLFKNGKVMKYANNTFKTWREQSHAQIIAQANWGARTIIATPVSLTCEYWPGDARTRDVSGQLDALFHLLVYAKVLKDDGLIYNCTWRRHELNRKFPKVVMEIAPYV